jgi:hypothetical protein
VLLRPLFLVVLPEAKRFKGVRFRDERNRWIAEMKPPRSKNKVSFGDFKSQTEAARAVDAAFFYYGKTEQHLNLQTLLGFCR